MTAWNRRQFLKTSSAAAAALSAGSLAAPWALGAPKPGSKMRMGLVTYLWGQDWNLPTLIANCEKAGYFGVETRTQHAHGVEPSLTAQQRKEVKKRFADSPVKLIGPGTNQQFDDPEPEKLKASIEGTKAFVLLSHDCGGSGVKVKPNSFHKEVPREVTIEQIGKSLNVVGAFAADHGQEIRLEVHGTCAELPVIKQIMDYVEQKNVGVCWNCNAEDLKGDGLAHNFNLVKDRFGATAHVRELDQKDYPYQDLFNLLVAMGYPGWILMEGRGAPKDRVAAMIEQRRCFEQMVAKAQGQS
ncbi:MAG: sugar phosphate isomerase/epimerase family protein [Thermoguttaceae bacterium]